MKIQHWDKTRAPPASFRFVFVGTFLLTLFIKMYRTCSHFSAKGDVARFLEFQIMRAKSMDIARLFCVGILCSVFLVNAGKRGVRMRLEETGPDDPDDRPDPRASSSGRPRGGLRKRLGTADPDDPDDPPADTDGSDADGATEKGPLTTYLKNAWTRGKLMTPQVQEIAFKAMGQGARDMEKFAAMGNLGPKSQKLFPRYAECHWVAEWGGPSLVYRAAYEKRPQDATSCDVAALMVSRTLCKPTQ